MALFATQIEKFVIDELERRELVIGRQDEKISHLTRYPFIVLESNAVSRENGSTDLAIKNILRTDPKRDIHSQLSRSRNFNEFGKQDWDVGFRPPPGITSLSVNNTTPLGSVRKAVVNFQCWTLEELETFQRLYMNPGIYLFLQWGVTKHDTNVQIKSLFTTDGGMKTLLKDLELKSYVTQNKGDYDALAGVCSTFSWKMNDMGGFDCSTTILSPASFVYSFKFDGSSIKNNLFFLWCTSFLDTIEDKDEDEDKEITATQEQEAKELLLFLMGLDSTVSNLKQYAISTIEGEKNTEIFFGEKAEYPNEYNKFIRLGNPLLIKSQFEDDNYIYISLGHLCTLIDNLFFYPNTVDEFKAGIQGVFESTTGYISKEQLKERERPYIDLNYEYGFCRSFNQLRSFTPKEVLIINEFNEKWVVDEIPLYKILTDNLTMPTGVSDITKTYFNVNFTPNKLKSSASAGFGYGRTKCIYISITTVAQLMRDNPDFNLFLDALLGTISDSVSQYFRLIKDADDDYPRVIRIIDETLINTIDAPSPYMFKNNRRTTVLKSITLDANLPNNFQVAAYAGNTNALPSQRDSNVSNAFSAVAGGYVDKQFFSSDNKKLSTTPADDSVDIKEEKEGWDMVINKPLYFLNSKTGEKLFFAKIKRHADSKAVSSTGMPVGINMNIKMDGIGGIYYGNLFILDYCPIFLKQNVCFQITNVSHEVGLGGWDTTLTGILRPLSYEYPAFKEEAPPVKLTKVETSTTAPETPTTAIKDNHAIYTREKILSVMKRKGYSFDEQIYKLNVIGIRNDDKVTVNQFNDVLCLLWKDENGNNIKVCPATTKPGLNYLGEKSGGEGGTAILVPNQYKSTYAIDLHRKAYYALTQRLGAVPVYRDNNKNKKFDFIRKAAPAYLGINIHRASKSGITATVGPHSAGCQVFKDASHFDLMMNLANKHKQKYSNSFTYTLLEEEDFYK